MRSAIKGVLRRLGWSVQQLKYSNSEEDVLRGLLQIVRPAAVLDVGANIGQFATLVRDAGFAGTLISFEALPAVHAQLMQRAAGDSNWIIAPCAALGRVRGEISMNVSGNVVSSSLLEMRSAHTDVAPASAYVARQMVRVERLDELALPLIPAAGDLFVKVDTQGFEMEVLLGATGIMERVAALQVELSLIPLYVNAPTLVEMVSYIEQLGFELYNLVPGYKDLQTGRVIQVDGFFVRSKR